MMTKPIRWAWNTLKPLNPDLKVALTQRDRDIRLVLSAQQLVDRAQREGLALLSVPRRMLEQLIEKAQRP